MSEYYEGKDCRDALAEENQIRKDSRRAMQKIKEHASRRINLNSLLDVGCGRGYFLDELRIQGYFAKGLDFSRSALRYAKVTLHLDVDQADILSYRYKAKYNAITLIQVIEHFSDPRRLIKKCYELLEDRGIIYIATPNIDSVVAKVVKDKFDYLIPPEHLSYFGKITLCRLLEEEGFKIKYVGSWGYPSDLAAVIKKLLTGNPEGGLTITQVNATKSTGRLSSSSSYDSPIKGFKSFLFDKLFCQFFYPLLNINGFGSILEVIAIKS